MSEPKFQSEQDVNWKDLPLHTVIYEWFLKNMNLPTDLGTLLAYIGLFLITWYTIIWMVRLVMSIIWPLFVICTAIVVFRIMQYYEPEEITAIMTKSLTVIADTMVTIVGRTAEVISLRKMPVAVRLIEVLTLVTMLGILTGFSIFVVVVQRIVFLSLYLLGPITQIVGAVLFASEKILIGTLMSILHLTHGVGNSVQN